MSNKNVRTKDFVLGAFVGSVVGAVTAVLLTPKSGKAVRKDIVKCSAKNANELRKASYYALKSAKKKSYKMGKSVVVQTNHLLSKITGVKQRREDNIEEKDQLEEKNQIEEKEEVQGKDDKQYISLQTDAQEKIEETNEDEKEEEKVVNN